MPKEPEGRGRLGTPFPSRGFLSPRCLAQHTHLPCRAEGSSRASLCPPSHNSLLSRGCFLTWPPCRASTWLSEMRSGRVFPQGFIFSLVCLDWEAARTSPSPQHCWDLASEFADPLWSDWLVHIGLELVKIKFWNANFLEMLHIYVILHV